LERGAAIEVGLKRPWIRTAVIHQRHTVSKDGGALGTVVVLDEHETADDDLVQEAAEETTDLGTLLPGEDNAITSSYADDAQLWLRTYEELFEFKQALLATLREQSNRVGREGMREVQNDEILLTREADRLSSRLLFWRREVGRRSPRDVKPRNT
jgi:hypothetical protein